ncbi:MAG: UDP-3-O-acyl-N-acetylglucosamine deacetylase, partial [Alphaproteobacteria bacterium]|nr:UDP-3-O-acyl-N-acetylglucosamine deacetylase [Alphaproteobacteria bacterium]
PVTVENGGRMAQLLPLASDAEDANDQGHDQYLRIDYDVEFSAPIGRQCFNFDLGRDDFIGEIAAARTFCFDDEVAMMQKHGLGLGGSLNNSVVIIRNPANGLNTKPSGDINVLNPQGLRFMDECVRHKILDAIGDLYLAGAPIIGHYKAHRGGHEMTNLLLRALFSDANNYEFV